jgi:hypothetical protein
MGGFVRPNSGEKLKVIEILEWDNFKDEANLKKYYEYNKTYTPYVRKKFEELNVKMTGGTDGTGHMVWVREYPSMEEYDKLRCDGEYQEKFVRFCRNVKKANLRILRPSHDVPPK